MMKKKERSTKQSYCFELGILLPAIQWTTYIFWTVVEDVCVNHSGLDVFVTK
jgi:hypothetical protein